MKTINFLISLVYGFAGITLIVIGIKAKSMEQPAIGLLLLYVSLEFLQKSQ
jgi:hypothetical protein